MRASPLIRSSPAVLAATSGLESENYPRCRVDVFRTCPILFLPFQCIRIIADQVQLRDHSNPTRTIPRRILPPTPQRLEEAPQDPTCAGARDCRSKGSAVAEVEGDPRRVLAFVERVQEGGMGARRIATPCRRVQISLLRMGGDNGGCLRYAVDYGAV